ncbi:uncharacterized protein LOC143682659 [Tamandua tetradactyla]|uniref:uncharacterized protein LOC143682659 n=1 Tax=Tamandua tetradactyla TaxID=48850 RepID=UPI004054445C
MTQSLFFSLAPGVRASQPSALYYFRVLLSALSSRAAARVPRASPHDLKQLTQRSHRSTVFLRFPPLERELPTGSAPGHSPRLSVTSCGWRSGCPPDSRAATAAGPTPQQAALGAGEANGKLADSAPPCPRQPAGATSLPARPTEPLREAHSDGNALAGVGVKHTRDWHETEFIQWT